MKDYLERNCAINFGNHMFKNQKQNRLIDKAVPTIFPLLEGSSNGNIMSERGNNNNFFYIIAAYTYKERI